RGYRYHFVLLPVRGRHHCPTLFPYTTLFRSVCTRPSEYTPRPAEMLNACEALIPTSQSALLRPCPALCSPSKSLPAFRLSKPCLDRKSTRLNSSHVKISYAVFCLKKKTIRKR